METLIPRKNVRDTKFSGGYKPVIPAFGSKDGVSLSTRENKRATFNLQIHEDGKPKTQEDIRKEPRT